MRSEFVETFKSALRKRLYPHTALRIDDLAYALGVNGFTVRSWLRGENCPSGSMVSGCISFFARSGDPQFICELFPDAVTPLIQKNKKAERALAFVESFKDVFEGAAA